MEPPIESQVLELLHRQGVEGERISQAFATRHGMHPTDVRALILIMDADRLGNPATPRALRRELVLTSGAVTAIVDRLEARGHVRRTRDGTDRRQVQLRPTGSARSLAGEYFGALAGRGRAVLAEFDAAELVVVHRFLHQMQQAMRDFAAEATPADPPVRPDGR